MDNRQSADHNTQQNPAQPQRRLYVYDRPFADIRPHAAPRPQSPPSSTLNSASQAAPPTPSQPQAVWQRPTVQTHQSIDGFRRVSPSPQQQPSSAFQLKPPVPDTPRPHMPAPAFHQPQEPKPVVKEPENPVWSMDMPDELQERPVPINTPRSQPATNANWRPLQLADASAEPPGNTWDSMSSAMPQPGYERQLQRNAKMHRVSPLARLRSLMSHGMKLMVILILAAGVFVAVNMIRANQAAKNMTGNYNQAEADDLGIFNTQPSEAQATGTLGVSQTADAPKAVKIDAIDLAARVVTVGTSRNSYIKAPANIYDLGWYEGSAKPGSKGVVLLNGHIAGPTRPGALYEVALLKRGDVISVERGDGKVYNYTVQAVEFFENDQMDMSKLLTPYNPNRNGLNIMTAGGRFNTETNAYELRAAVYAVEDN